MRWLNNFKTALLLAAMMALFMVVGRFVLGPQGIWWGFMLGGFANIGAYFYSDKIALAATGSREIHRDDMPWLYDMVAELARRANLPMPRVYVSPQPAPNAFATGRNPAHAAVAVTEGMLRNFPQAEIEGVLAHELSHVKHRDVLISTIAATLAGIISYAGYALLFAGGRDDRNNPFGAIGVIAMVVLAPIAAMLIQLAISRQREFAADARGGELSGDPLRLAAALRRLQSLNERIPTDTNPAFNSLYIMRPLSGGGVSRWFSTHPPTEQRIAALEQQARDAR